MHGYTAMPYAPFETQIHRKARGLAGVLALVATVMVACAQPASAQLFFDWGGGEEKKPNDTGRKVVKFNSDAKVGEIIVSFSDRKLYHVIQPGVAVAYPVASPREQDRWEGKTAVTQKRENPSWTPTPSMLKENPKLPRWVPGGHPMNPLGVRALYLGSSLYRIHGTDAPWTIGTAVSKGCIRMYNKDAEDLYNNVKVGAKVLVTWKAFDTSPGNEQLRAPVAESSAPAEKASDSSRRKSRAAENEDEASEPVRSSSHKAASSRERNNITVEQVQPAATQRKTTERSAAGATNTAEAKSEAKPEPKSKAARVETGSASKSTSHRNAQSAEQAAKAQASAEPAAQPAALTAVQSSPVQEKPQAVAITPGATKEAGPSSADIAQRALEAAERAAAAAERAAAAAERAERASTLAASKVKDQEVQTERKIELKAPATSPAETPASRTFEPQGTSAPAGSSD